jgi:hypothetical protein
MRASLGHPAFAPYARWLARLGDAAPAPAMLAAWVDEAQLALPDGRRLRVVAAASRIDALGYERRVHDDATIAVRPGSWHDAFNVATWLAFPRTKAALNARHRTEGAAPTQNRRSRIRDAATLLDESGLVVACDQWALVELVRAHAWREAFVARADDMRLHWRAFAFGHGLLERLRAPHRALTAKMLALPFAGAALPEPDDTAAIDAAAAQAVRSPAFRPEALSPLPVAALLGWDPSRRGDLRFDDASVFRPKMLRSLR